MITLQATVLCDHESVCRELWITLQTLLTGIRWYHCTKWYHFLMISVHFFHGTFWYHSTTSTAVLLHGTSPQQPKHQYAWTQYYIPFEWLHLKLSAFGCYLTELNSLFPMTQHRTHPWPHTTLYIFTVIAYWCTIHWCLSTSVSPYSFCLIQQYNGDHDVQLK